MSLVINSIVFGGTSFSSSNAIVRVTVDSGSTVSMARTGSTINASEIALNGSSGQSIYYLVVRPGEFGGSAWTITATKGMQTVTKSISINAAGEYVVGMSYWDGILYEAGDEKTAVTGGYDTFAPVWGSVVSGCIRNASSLQIDIDSGQYDWKNGAFGTVNVIDVSAFSTLNILATTASSVGSHADNFRKFGIADAKNTSTSATVPYGTINVGTSTLDISSVSSGYIWFGGSTRSSGSTDIIVTKIWLS